MSNLDFRKNCPIDVCADEDIANSVGQSRTDPVTTLSTLGTPTIPLSANGGVVCLDSRGAIASTAVSLPDNPVVGTNFIIAMCNWDGTLGAGLPFGVSVITSGTNQYFGNSITASGANAEISSGTETTLDFDAGTIGGILKVTYLGTDHITLTGGGSGIWLVTATNSTSF